MLTINLGLNSPQDTMMRHQSVCMGVSAGLHLLLFLLNPTLLKSDWRPAHDFVTIDVVDQSAPGGYVQPEAPQKMGLMDTLKDMLMKPKMEHIAHIAPGPVTTRVAAPIQPSLKERIMPKAISTAFQPKSQSEDLAAVNAPNSIKTTAHNVALPTAGPTLTAKSFGGIRAKDLPFQVGTDESISGGASVIPIAMGKNSAKAALSYGGATLQDASKRRVGIQPMGVGAGSTSDMSALGAGAASTIQLSGTGGTGNAPSGATSGTVLQDRAGSGGSGRVSRALFGSGRGTGLGSGVEGMPSAAQELDSQLGAGGRGKKTNKGFEIAGPLNNRPIVRKVIPQYPAWAEEQGIIGSVRLYFTVTPEGSVRSNIRVTKTTGYPQLDQLGIDALKQWQFAPLNVAEEGQWGIITFNFSLSS